jgi:hypothetical protein
MAALLVVVCTAQAQAQLRDRLITGERLQRMANGVLSMMAYTIAPDVTTSSLSLQDATTDNPNLAMTQFGGGFVWSDELPIFLEGNAAYSRYDPRFVASDGTDERLVPLKWNAVSGTGGIGYNFRLGSKWSFRPIFNFTLGHVASDLQLAERLFEHRNDAEIDFMTDGRLKAYGLGGSLMVVYQYFKPDRELEFEGRYTNVHLRSYGNTSEAVQGEAIAESINLWARMRIPTGLVVMDRPVRYVFELAHSRYLDSGVRALGFNELTSFGLGLELDSSAYDIWVTRWRAVIRHVVGDNVSGWSLGLAVSF